MRRIISPLGVAVIGSLVQFATALGGAGGPRGATPPGEVRKTVARGLDYLTKEGVAWMKKQECAACHHIPMMVWAMHEARGRGYRIDEKALGEVTSWALAEKNHAQVFQDLPLDKKRTETDYLGPLFLALAVGADHDRDEAAETARRRLLAHAVRPQEKDGSWNANSGGRPPVHASRDVQTGWLLLALSDRSAGQAREDPWQAQREAAAGWLSRNAPAETPQALAVRLLVEQRLGKPAADVRPLWEALLRLQNEDGGWGQTKQMKSDAFATGLSLYVLNGQPGAEAAAARDRAQAFLLKSQQPDGSWPMTSRRAEPKGPGPAGDLRPIRYVGTAWAILGLVRSAPETVSDKRN